MDSGLGRAVVGAALVAGLVLAGREAAAQLTEPPQESPPAAETTPPQPAPDNAAGNSATPPAANATSATNSADEDTGTSAAPAPPPPVAKPPAPPPGPPLPLRTPTAIMQVLDKVTAETLQFEAPVGAADPLQDPGDDRQGLRDARRLGSAAASIRLRGDGHPRAWSPRP